MGQLGHHPACRGDAGGLEGFARLRKDLEKVPIRTARKAEAAFALESLLTAADLCCRAALHREECRGAHHREDPPTQDDGRRLPTVLLERDDSGAVRVTARPVPPPASLRAPGRRDREPSDLRRPDDPAVRVFAEERPADPPWTAPP